MNLIHEGTRKGIDDSDVFLAIITPGYITDADALEQAKYANDKRKPVILLVQENSGLDGITGFFKDTKIIDVIFFKKGDDGFKEKVMESIKKFTGIRGKV